MAQIKWSATGGGDWATKADWTGGVVPTSADDAVIAAAGTYTVTLTSADAAKSLTVNDAAAIVAVNTTGVLTLGGALTVSAGAVQLNSGGEISGGVLSATGGSFQWNGGILDGATYDGTLDLSAASESLFIGPNGITARNAAGTGAGTINLIGADFILFVEGSQTLDKATVDIGNASGNYSTIAQDDLTGKGAVLTFGAGLTLVHAGLFGRITGSGDVGDEVVNKGVIDLNLDAGQFLVDCATFINQGTVALANGDTLNLRPTSFSNASGTMSVDKLSTFNLDCDLTTVQLGSVANAGTMVIEQTLTNSGSVLAVGNGAKLGTLTLASSGEISGGTITDAGAGFIFSGGTFDGVTYEGTLDLSPQFAENISITNKGLVAKGPGGVGNGKILLTGNDSSLFFLGTQTFDKATVEIGDSFNTCAIDEDDSLGAGAVLTLGAGLTINHTGNNAAINGSSSTGDVVINKGVINADLSGGAFRIDPLAFTNQGTITVSNGDQVILQTLFDNTAGTLTVDKTSTVDLAGNLTTADLGGLTNAGTLAIQATLTNSGAVLAVGTGTKLGTVTLAGTGKVIGGTIADAGAGMLCSGGGTFDGVTYQGTLDLSPQFAESISITNKGLVTTGAGGVGIGKILLTGNDSTLFFLGTQTFDKATVEIGDPFNTCAIDEDDSLGAGAVLTLGAGLTIDHAGNNAAIDGSATAGDAVVNKGVINASLSGGNFTLDPLTFVNQGTIAVSNGDTVSIQTLLNNIAGKLTVGAGSAVDLTSATVAEVQGAISNAGAIAIEGAGGGSNTDMRIFAAGLTLSGAGVVSLGGSKSRILGVSSSATLTNVDNTLSGSGFIGLGQMTFINQAAGVVDASVHGASLTLGTAGKTLANAGLLEATNGGTLVIASTTVNDAGGGMISAVASRVDLQVADVIGGTLKSAGGAIVVNALGSALDGTGGHAVTLAGGQIALDDKTSLTLLGAIVNKGTFIVAAATGATDLIVGAGGSTLSGGGGITLTANAFNAVTANVAATLTNVDNRIVGAGTIGGANLTLINQAKGFIGSNSAVTLTIDTGGHVIANAGVIEGGNGTGGLTIAGAVANTGKLIALQGSLTVNGAVTGAGTASLAGGTLTFASSFNEAVSFGAGTSTLALAQSQSYGATISGFTNTGSTRLDLKDILFKSAGEATFSGGVLTVTDGTRTAHIHLAGSFTGSTFVASSDGHGGTIVVDPATGAAARFVSAMAAMPAAAPTHSPQAGHWREAARVMLAMPRAGQIA